jgi:hypothetical protein
MPLAAWLLTMVGPLVGRILLALGFSIITIKGMDIVVNQLKAQIVGGAASMIGDLYSLFMISGGGIAMGIIMGAINTRIALWTASKATRILGTSSS